MGALNWELVRDLHLARLGVSVHPNYVVTDSDVMRLEMEVQATQIGCAHERSPERPGQCWRCSKEMPLELRKCSSRRDKRALKRAG
jgi:hypothetical protein